MTLTREQIESWRKLMVAHSPNYAHEANALCDLALYAAAPSTTTVVAKVAASLREQALALAGPDDCERLIEWRAADMLQASGREARDAVLEEAAQWCSRMADEARKASIEAGETDLGLARGAAQVAFRKAADHFRALKSSRGSDMPSPASSAKPGAASPS